MKKTRNTQSLTRPTRAFAEVIADLMEPLCEFLDHPALNDESAEDFVDAVENFFNIQSPPVGHSECVRHLLGAFVREGKQQQAAGGEA